jgi:PPOX class probable F420-dependent enzyme
MGVSNVAVPLSEAARRLLDGRVFAVLSTVTSGGAPRSSVIWVKRDGDDVLFSTIRGRLKTRNMEREPRVSLCLYHPRDPYQYVEISGEVSLTEDGGDALIDELSRAYDGMPWHPRPDQVRVVCRVRPTRVVERITPQSPQATSG